MTIFVNLGDLITLCFAVVLLLFFVIMHILIKFDKKKGGKNNG